MGKRTITAVLAALALASAGCGGKTGELATAVCDCEHCDDWKEKELLALLDAESSVADAYACDIEFESLIQCQIDEGKCDEKQAKFLLADQGRCDGEVQCTTDVECMAIGAACGVSGVCDKKLCAGSSTDTCNKDSDCPSGKNRCESEETELNTCIDDASDHNGVKIDGG